MDERDEETGKFLPGNRFWEARSTHGRKPIFETADALEKACTEYFEWVQANPLGEEKVFCSEGSIVRGTLSKMMAMTQRGLCLFLDISPAAWANYRDRPDYVGVCEWAEGVIYHQKFTGAAAGQLNPAIIARDLGLVDKQDLNHGGEVAITRSLNDFYGRPSKT